MEKLVIENFGPLKKVELDLRPMMTFIGPQSTGKSIAAKIITILRSDQFVFGRTTFVECLEQYNIGRFITAKSIIFYQCESYRFTYRLGKGKLHYFNAKKLRSLTKGLAETEAVDDNIDDSKLQKKIEDLMAQLHSLENKFPKTNPKTPEEESHRVEFRKLIGEVKPLLDRFKKRVNFQKEFLETVIRFTNYSVYIPGERQLIPTAAGKFLSLQKNDIGLPKSIVDFGSAYEKARENIKELSIDFLGVTFRYHEGEDRVFYTKTKSLSLLDSSSGFQASIPMLLVIENNYSVQNLGHTFVVEEPELNLYPKAQMEIVKFIVNRCRHAHNGLFNELIITTHSPYVLSTVNNLLMAFKTGSLPGKAKKINKIIDEKSWINPTQFNAYFFDKGIVKKIFNEETGLIEEEELDVASEIIMSQFDQLSEIYVE
jgi:predicted ATPase